MSNFPDFDFKIDCGDDPRVRQWLHDNGCCWLGGTPIVNNHTEAKMLFVEGKDVTWHHNHGYFMANKLTQINPYNYMKPEPTVADRMAALIEEHKDRIPDWANFIAVDKDKEVRVFQNEPSLRTIAFGRRSGDCISLGRMPIDFNWRETLTELATIKQSLTVEHNSKPHANDEMIKADERELTPLERDVIWEALHKSGKLIHEGQQAEFPSTCPTEQSMPMMLGGNFGGVK